MAMQSGEHNRITIPRRRGMRRISDLKQAIPGFAIELEDLRRELKDLYTLPQVRAAIYTRTLAKLHALGKTAHLYEVFIVADHARPNAKGEYPAWWTRTPHPNKFVIVEHNAREGKAYTAEQIDSWIEKLSNS